jgi:glutathione S-transferase
MCSANLYLMPSLVTALAVILFMVVTKNVGGARARYKVQAPATTGHPDFERYYRVQMNTLEALAMFLPALWLCAVYLSPEGAGLLGFVWLIGRVLYARGYYIATNKRAAGFIISILASTLLVLGGIGGIIQQWLN